MRELTDRLTGEAGPYNATFTQNGIASTTATIIAASMGFTEIDNLTPDQIEQIKNAHLLLVMFNALAAGRLRAVRLGPGRHAHPGSEAGQGAAGRRGHPLDPPVGVRPDGLPARRHRVDLADAARGAACTARCRTQLDEARSFARRLRDILEIRKQFGIATGIQLDVPQVSNRAMLVMVHQLAEAEQITVLNFSAQRSPAACSPSTCRRGGALVDMTDRHQVGEVDDLHSFAITLGPHEGLTLLVGEA